MSAERFNCRESQRRKNIVSKYNLTCYGFYVLLEGKSKMSCTGYKLTDKYYIFTYQNKINNQSGSFYAGTYAGEHFLKLTEKKSPKLFNPLIVEQNIDIDMSERDNSSPKKHPKQTLNKTDLIKKKLLQAINIVIIKWNNPPTPESPLFKIKDELKNDSILSKNLHQKVKAINTIISRDKNHPDLFSMLQYLKNQGNKVRNFDFSILSNVLKENYSQVLEKKEIIDAFKIDTEI